MGSAASAWAMRLRTACSRELTPSASLYRPGRGRRDMSAKPSVQVGFSADRHQSLLSGRPSSSISATLISALSPGTACAVSAGSAAWQRQNCRCLLAKLLACLFRLALPLCCTPVHLSQRIQSRSPFLPDAPANISAAYWLSCASCCTQPARLEMCCAATAVAASPPCRCHTACDVASDTTGDSVVFTIGMVAVWVVVEGKRGKERK